LLNISFDEKVSWIYTITARNSRGVEKEIKE
jgi:hypothetical protein